MPALPALVPQDLPELLRLARLRRRWTLWELSRIAAVSPQHLSELERGRGPLLHNADPLYRAALRRVLRELGLPEALA